MKKLIFYLAIFLSIILFQTNSFAQNGFQFVYSKDQVSNIAFINEGTGYICSGSLLKTTNKGISWEYVLTIPNYSIKLIDFFGSDTGYIVATRSLFPVGSDNKIYKTINSGLNWTPVGSGGLRLNTSTIFSNNDYIVGGEYGERKKTTDGGVTWINTSGFFNFINSIKILKNNIGISVGMFNGPGRIAKTYDGGLNWIYRPSSTQVDTFSSILTNVEIFNDSTGFIVGEKGRVYKFKNLCDSIYPINLNTTKNFWDVKFNNLNTGFITGDSGKIFKTTDGGNNWIRLNSPTTSAIKRIYIQNDSVIYLCSEAGILKTTNGGVTSYNPNSTLLPDYKLFQNYPNPFNPETNIKFQIPKSSFVNLKIYDLMGREVEILVSEKLNSGEYNVSWNASNFSSGVYFYKLQTENFIQTKKMLLVK